jgi:hypothetical protein
MHDANPFTAAHDLLRDHEANTVLFDNLDNGPDEWANRAFHAALAGHIPEHLFETSKTTPLLRWSDPDTPAVALLDALFDPPNHRAHHCDRCAVGLRHQTRVYRLWMPGGQSAVEFQFCPRCHDLLNDIYRDADAGLGPDHRLLVWR